ncbi:MAG: class II fumarate hydratase [Deltaproteobacteria bacterium]|nr:class II fumarate hydratase [Deltaproteobacteria bacterium]
MKKRIEKDTMGEVEVPERALWGAQTERALRNGVAVRRLPWELTAALVLIKKGAALVNRELGLLSPDAASAIVRAADEVLSGKLEREFPLSPFQTGSGTSSNMNANEVLANRANELLGGRRGEKSPIHPNDHVNRCQSSNDVFPTAIHVAALQLLEEELLPASRKLHAALARKAEEFAGVLKLGRTHLMDALPVTLGQEFGAYARQVELGVARIRAAAKGLRELPLGGTAVGTGMNAHPEFATRVIAWLAEQTGLPLVRAGDAFEAQSARDACVSLSGSLRGLAVSLSKIANDLRWLASGPHGGLAELRLPELQPGSSIMPGKVNPVVPEAVLQASAQVLADDLAVAQGGSGGVFELNLMMPLIATNLLEELQLLSGACRLLAERCVEGLTADPERCRALLEGSLALATPLAEVVGYEAVGRVVALARRERISLLEAALRAGLASEEELRRLLAPAGMVGRPDR